MFGSRACSAILPKRYPPLYFTSATESFPDLCSLKFLKGPRMRFESLQRLLDMRWYDPTNHPQGSRAANLSRFPSRTVTSGKKFTASPREKFFISQRPWDLPSKPSAFRPIEPFHKGSILPCCCEANIRPTSSFAQLRRFSPAQRLDPARYSITNTRQISCSPGFFASRVFFPLSRLKRKSFQHLSCRSFHFVS